MKKIPKELPLNKVYGSWVPPDDSLNDYNFLPLKDRKLIDQIEALLKKLSPKGKEYWRTYYS